MIPKEDEAKALWDKYELPEQKRIHVGLVAKVAVFFANELRRKNNELRINTELLNAAALLHDIDKHIPKLPGESHPDAGVRVLREEGMEDVAELVRTHPVHSILDPVIAPKTIEQKLLFLSDKMVKFEVLTVDKRFALWNAEHLPQKDQEILDRAYPKVKALEKEIFDTIGLRPEEVAGILKKSILG